MNESKRGRAVPIAGALAAVLMATVATAGEPIHERMPAASDGVVTVENVSGSVVVTGWDEKEVLVEGTLGEGAERLEIEIDSEDDEITIEVVLPRRGKDVRKHVEGTDLILRIPRGSYLEVETVSAGVEVGGIEDGVEVETVSGSVDVSGGGDAEIETVSGAIRVSDSRGYSRLESVSGAIRVKGCAGRLEASTTSGRMSIEDSDLERIDCETVSGSIDVDLKPAKQGRYGFETLSGTLTLLLPADLNASIEAETFSGKIRSEFDGRIREERYGPGASLSATYGDGDADIAASSFSGAVELKKK